jgi:glutathione synthase/RimK-type ligase-like ATP-grasp enzyme
VELIEKKDYARLAEYDGLLIRETTSVDNHTYRFAKKAESEGLVVMDDPPRSCAAPTRST